MTLTTIIGIFIGIFISIVSYFSHYCIKYNFTKIPNPTSNQFTDFIVYYSSELPYTVLDKIANRTESETHALQKVIEQINSELNPHNIETLLLQEIVVNTEKSLTFKEISNVKEILTYLLKVHYYQAGIIAIVHYNTPYDNVITVKLYHRLKQKVLDSLIEERDSTGDTIKTITEVPISYYSLEPRYILNFGNNSIKNVTYYDILHMLDKIRDK